jgi:hypothetical protein
MQPKNPTDLELIAACQEAHEVLSRIAEYMRVPSDHGTLVRLDRAITAARTEIEMMEKADGIDLLSPLDPPGSND